MRRLFLMGCLLALPAFSALAKQPYVELEKRFSAEQMRATGLDTLSSEQLQLLNSLLSDEIRVSVEAEVEQARMESAAAATSGDAGASGKSANFIGLNEAPISSRLKGTISGWEPGTVFELENGQQWKVLKGKVTLREPLLEPEIKVVPGFAGRWFLQVVEDMPKARVYRID
ncbi:hypothetical protein [Dokdonella sp.]|uniref:hypothetical protein n=1 Tax=Dokdonella sp. TaxID=2291710 RepID=UPI003529AF5E